MADDVVVGCLMALRACIMLQHNAVAATMEQFKELPNPVKTQVQSQILDSPHGYCAKYHMNVLGKKSAEQTDEEKNK